MNRFVTGLVALGAVLTLSPVSSWAASDGAKTQSDIDRIIASHGGVQTARDTISWDGGSTTLKISNDLSPAADSCAVGSYCVFSGAYYGGNKLSMKACPATITDLSLLLAPVASASNKRTSGTVRLYASSTVKSTLAPGQAVPAVSGITKLTCG